MSKNNVFTLAKSVLVYGSGDMLQKIASFMLIPLYTAYLAPGDFGIVALIGTMVSILSIVHMLGLDAGVLRYYYDMEENHFKNYLKTIYLFLLAFGIFIAVVLISNASIFSQLIFKRTGMEIFIRYAVVTFFSMNIVNLCMNLWVSKQESSRFTFFSLFNFILITACVLYFVIFRQEGALGQVKGTAIGWGILLVVFGLIVFRYLRSAPADAEGADQLGNLRETLKYGLPFLPHIIMVWFFSGLDVLVLNYMCSLEDVGIFSLGARIGMVMFFVTSALNRAWTPFFFGICKEEVDTARSSKYFTYVIFAMVVLLLSMVLFYKEILVLMVNERYNRSLGIVPIFLLAYFFNGLYFVFISPVLYNKKTRYMPVISLFTLLFYGICLFVLVEFFGIYGAAYASVMTYLLRFLLAYHFSSRDYVFGLEKTRILKLSISACLILAASFMLHFNSLILQVTYKAVLFLSLFLVLYIWDFPSSGELQVMNNFVRGKGGPEF